MKRNIILSLAAVSLLGWVGCATDNSAKTETPKETKDTRPIEQRLTVGMSKDDVRKALGNPNGTSVNSDGEETWNYNDTAKAWIPFYSIGGGKFQHLNVNFDKDGKVKNWANTTTSAY